VLGAGVADSEVQVRALGGPHTGRTHRSDRFARGDPLALVHGGGGQVQVRGVVEAVGGSDAHGQPGGAGGSREAHLTAGGGYNRCARLGGDVDAAVLPRGVRIVAVSVGSDHLPANRPDPIGARGSGGKQDGEERDGDESAASHARERRRAGRERGRGRGELLRNVAKT
jgi:hypothetical protein